MLRSRCVPLAGAALAAGSLAVISHAAAARMPHAGPAGSVVSPPVRLAGPPAGRGLITSSNWSGYVAHGGTYSRVSASWTEPTGTCTTGHRYSSFWVGLDGYGSRTVEQTGSEVDCAGGTPKYYSWYEMYPAYPVNFASPVRPGDRFTGSVTYHGAGAYTLVLKDLTQGWSHSVHKSLLSGKNASAEVIAEAPCCTASGGILPLADFGTVRFTAATVDGSPIGSAHPTRIVMVDGQGRDQDTVSSLSHGQSFSATWLRSN
jgi:hypothetical protein